MIQQALQSYTQTGQENCGECCSLPIAIFTESRPTKGYNLCSVPEARRAPATPDPEFRGALVILLSLAVSRHHLLLRPRRRPRRTPLLLVVPRVALRLLPLFFRVFSVRLAV